MSIPKPVPPGTLISTAGPGFPPDTSPEEMTPEEQVAFHKRDADKWKALSRKHETRYDAAVAALLEPAVRAEFKARAPHVTEEELTVFLDDIGVTPDSFFADGALNTERIDRLAALLARTETRAAPAAVSLGGVLSRGTAPTRKTGSGDSRQAAYSRTKSHRTN